MKKCITVSFILLNIMFACGQSGQKTLTVAHLCDPQLGFGGFVADSTRFERTIERVNELSPDIVVIAGDMVNSIGKRLQYANRSPN
jgi:metallophosphoesterase superfamily enzyme